jgi:L-rhamnose mutarotase
MWDVAGPAVAGGRNGAGRRQDEAVGVARQTTGKPRRQPGPGQGLAVAASSSPGQNAVGQADGVHPGELAGRRAAPARARRRRAAGFRADLLGGGLGSPNVVTLQLPGVAAPDPFVGRYAMRRVCFTLQVSPDKLDEYRSRHAAVWPEMLAALHDAGWHDYSIFLRDDGLVVGYFLTEDLAAAQEAMAATDVNARWQADMARFFVGGSDGLRGIQVLEEVFNLDAQLGRIGERR